MTTDGPPLPDKREWGRFGVSDMVELHAGHQSRVFRARVDNADAAIKLTDARFADATALGTRMEVVEALATSHPSVVAPLHLDGELMQTVSGWLVTATVFQHGDTIDFRQPGTAELLGQTLSELHNSLVDLPRQPLPPVAALDGTPPNADRSGWQLLHGDFSDQNTIATPTGLRIFDFDDCGYGPIDHDVANSLYMVLFDAEVHGRTERYEAFCPAFPTGYADGSGTRLDNDVIDDLITTRVEALAGWLDDLTAAPIGIRTSSAAWQDVLRTFVRSYRGR